MWTMTKFTTFLFLIFESSCAFAPIQQQQSKVHTNRIVTVGTRYVDPSLTNLCRGKNEGNINLKQKHKQTNTPHQKICFETPLFVVVVIVYNSRLYDTVVLEKPEIATVTVKGPTRFDALKARYKGIKNNVPSSSSSSGVDNVVSFSYEDFASAVDNVQYAFERNTIVEGVAVEYSPAGCLVDIGAKASAFLPILEASLTPVTGGDLSNVLPLDVPMQFQIISEEDENGQLLVSIKRLQYKAAWETVKALAAADSVVTAEVIAVNRGGAICLIEGLRAFLPGSHLGGGQMPGGEDLIGQKLPLKFLEVNDVTNKLVVSHRKAIVEQQMADLSRGDLVSGVVKAIKPYGAFVEVGGMSGLLHISQISYDRIDDLEKVLSPGMLVKCMIIDHDKVNGRIALSTKTLEAEPGDMLRDASLVFDNAEATAAAYHARMQAERQAREDAARDIVLGLGDSLSNDENGNAADDASSIDPLQDVSDSLDSLLS
jgi:small subunit ribosomal protein S1